MNNYYETYNTGKQHKSEDNKEKIKQFIYDEGNATIKILNNRLINNNYFFGKQPTTIDAILFGCMAPLIYVPMPITSYSNSTISSLSNFCQSILSSYFLVTPPTLSFNKTTNSSNNNNTDNNDNKYNNNQYTFSNNNNQNSKKQESLEDKKRRRDNILFIGISSVVMIGYVAFQYISGHPIDDVLDDNDEDIQEFD